MSHADQDRWLEANKRYLEAAMRRVRCLLARSVSEGARELPDASVEEATAALEQRAAELPSPSALDTLCAELQLSPFERDVLVCCAAVELDAQVAACCAAAQGSGTMWASPTFGLALAALTEPHWSALTPAAPLRRWRLVELGPGPSLTASPLRIDERILHFLLGVSYLDERLDALVTPIHAQPELPESHRAVAHEIAQCWARGDRMATVIQLHGRSPASMRAIAAAACAEMNLHLHGIRAADLPLARAELEALVRLWEREAVLAHSAVLIERDDGTSADSLRAACSFVDRSGAPIIVASREPLRLRAPTVVCMEVKPLDAGEQRAAWNHALGPLAPSDRERLDPLIAQFTMDLQDIHAASAEARALCQLDGSRDIGHLLWDACRVRARPRLDELAQRIEPAARWDELVLPQAQRELLRQIAANVRQRAKVYDAWGFEARGTRGLGISALFAGPSGTGKTMAAEVLAHELRLDLYRIDLSQLVSKYIGETEKNLRRVFDAAETGGAVLLFDEADALFGKRSEVKDSHDRYANIEVSYLLQRMESYRGLAILTTNMRNVIDGAFLRRIHFAVQFPFPDMAQRAEIWRRVFPERTPTEGLDITKLARLNVPGGNIRSIALNAAFMAAETGEPVRMAHLLRAARAEYIKLEKTFVEVEVAGWA